MANARTFATVIAERLKELAALKSARDRGEEVHTFIPTGLARWDKNGGLDIGVLTVVGAPTGEGKSVLLLHLACAAAKAGFKVVLISIEDPANKTADRSLAALTGLNSREIGRLEFDDGQIRQLVRAAKDSKEWAELIEFHSGIVRCDDVLSLLKASDASLVLIDYAQAFPDGGKGLERTIAEFALALNMDAQENSRATVLFSQTKPDIETRGAIKFEKHGKVDGYKPGPGKGDLQWATALGDRCKTLIYLFRPGRWERKCGMTTKDDRLVLIAAKANFGDEGEMLLRWDGPTSTISDPKGPQ